MNSQANVNQQENCVRRSIVKGIKSGLIAFIVSGAVVYGLNFYSTRFRHGLGVSGKTALVTTPMMFMFFLDSHLEMGVCTEEEELRNKQQ
eukprot:g8652.t1